MRGVARTARPAPGHAGVSGLGRPHRPAPGGRARGPLRAHRRRQHLPADRRPAGRRRVHGVAQVLAGNARVSRRRHSAGRLRHPVGCRQSSPPTTRRFPTSATRPARGSSRRWCRSHPTIRPYPRTARRGTCCAAGAKPFLTAFSDSDPVTRGGDAIFQQEVPGAQGQPHTTITGAGHFLQEDKGEDLARVVIDFLART